MNTIRRLIHSQPQSYYCIVTGTYTPGSSPLPPPMGGNRQLFSAKPMRIYSSLEWAESACKAGEEAFDVRCLRCFVGVVRNLMRFLEVMIDGELRCTLHAWRTPCETTGVVQADGRMYYLDGCEQTGGVLWKPVSLPAIKPPNYFSCPSDRIDCIWDWCPGGWQWFEDEPITLCPIREYEATRDQDGLVVSGVVEHGGHRVEMYYLDITPEGFDFAKKRSDAVRLERPLARRIAIAMSASYLSWAGSSLRTGVKYFRISNEQGEPVMDVLPLGSPDGQVILTQGN